MNEQFSCSICDDGTKLQATDTPCSGCGREPLREESLFEAGEASIAASMDEAFEGIVLESTKKGPANQKDIWWYVSNGRRIGPVSREELIIAVAESSEPMNVLIWNEGFSNWRRFGEVTEFQSTTDSEEPTNAETVVETELSGNTNEEQHDTQLDSAADVLSDLPEIGEEALEPEGQPLSDWSPSAAHTLRGLATSEQSVIEPDTWDEDGDDIGLPPSVDTAEFKRDEVFARTTQKSGPSAAMVAGTAFLLALGAYVVGLQFWSSQPQSIEQTEPKVSSVGGTEAAVSKPTEVQDPAPLPPTSIQATSPANSEGVEKKPKPSKPVKKKKRRPKKAVKLPSTVTDGQLESRLKTNSTSLAPCIEGAVSAKELPAGRHVMTLAYDILPSGRVSGASLVGPNYLLGGALSRCVESTISGWRFPKTAKGREVRGQELAFRARAP